MIAVGTVIDHEWAESLKGLHMNVLTIGGMALLATNSMAG